MIAFRYSWFEPLKEQISPFRRPIKKAITLNAFDIILPARINQTFWKPAFGNEKNVVACIKIARCIHKSKKGLFLYKSCMLK